ncbi:hypothetical protein CDAR_539801 [Caerostris darwini]|uniref:Uncharacterized protein n=1 Tax=Caerostris darwini TaxID=1538125 RepID=A0AAV4R777_9ARAC|nr:hypothetical protein CDAR_539801 [Caerostris darwini]
MGRAKLPPDEADKKPEVKQKIREAERKRRLEKRLKKLQSLESEEYNKSGSDMTINVPNPFSMFSEVRLRLDCQGKSWQVDLETKIPGEKTRLRTADPPADDDPRLECGPDPWNFTAQMDWEGNDAGYAM